MVSMAAMTTPGRSAVTCALTVLAFGIRLDDSSAVGVPSSGVVITVACTCIAGGRLVNESVGRPDATAAALRRLLGSIVAFIATPPEAAI